MTPKNSSDAVEPIVKLFSGVESAGQPRWLLPLRKAGLASFAEAGFPTLQDEDWRFTNLASLVQLPYPRHSKPRALPNCQATASFS